MNQTNWLRLRMFSMLALGAAFSGAISSAANLHPDTVTAWDEYLKVANARLQLRLSTDRGFLWIDEAPDRMAKVRKRQIVVAPAGPHIPKKVPSGLIHDWIGASFIPNTTIRDVLSVLRDYPRYKEIYHPHVIESRPIDKGETEDRFSIVLMNASLFSKTALDSDYRTSYVRLDDRRMYSVTQTTRIQEIAEWGAPGQHMLAEDEGTGLIWRLYSITRFEERNGGLFIEVEAIALSRDIPVAIRLVADPIVRRVSREALETALHQTEVAIQSASVARR